MVHPLQTGGTLTAGDRVAILGRGIGVVEQADEKHVHVLLWNRTALRIGCKEIAWDDGNARWEASGSGVDFIHDFHLAR
jgi:hypothetical protein